MTDVNAPRGHVPELVWYAQVEKFGAEMRCFGCRGTRLLQDMVRRCVFVYEITNGGADIIMTRKLEICCTDDDLDDNRLPSALECV